MLVDRVHFPASALEYLRRHKGDADARGLCQRQVDRARKQIDDLRPVLAEFQLRSVLDIGCGLGLVDVLLVQEFGVLTVHLVDGDGTGARRSDYAEDVLPWNDVGTAGELVRANTPASVEVLVHHADVNLDAGKVDAVVSFKSWGLHYPVHTYLDLACRSLDRGGLLVLDIHDERAGCREVEAAGFRMVTTIGEYGEPARSIIPFTRHVFTRTS